MVSDVSAPSLRALSASELAHRSETVDTASRNDIAPSAPQINSEESPVASQPWCTRGAIWRPQSIKDPSRDPPTAFPSHAKSNPIPAASINPRCRKDEDQPLLKTSSASPLQVNANTKGTAHAQKLRLLRPVTLSLIGAKLTVEWARHLQRPAQSPAMQYLHRVSLWALPATPQCSYREPLFA